MRPMPEYKILISDGLSEEGMRLLQDVGEVTSNPRITAEELVAVLPGFDALIVRSRTKVSEAVLEAGQRLKVVGRAGVGVDNIDLAAAATPRHHRGQQPAGSDGRGGGAYTWG